MTSIFKYNGPKKEAGFGLVETVVSLAIFLAIAGAGTTSVLHSLSANLLGEQEATARMYAQEGIEAVKALKNEDWDDPVNTTDCTAGCGLDTTSGQWSISGTQNVFDHYTRTVVIEPVERNSSGEIVSGGGTIDPNSLRVISRVAWQFSPVRFNEVALTTYITNFSKPVPVCDWSDVSIVSTVNLPTSYNGGKIQYSNGYVYATLMSSFNAPNNFAVVDVSDPTSPVPAGTLSIPGVPTDLYVTNNYAYIVSADNSNELVIADITNPNTPQQIGTYNAAGNSDAYGIWVVGTTAYVTKLGSAQNEFFVVDVTNPAAPVELGSANLGSTAQGGRDVWVSGNYAYIASEDDTKELKIVDVSNPANPQYLSTNGYNITGNVDGNSVTGSGTTLYVGATDGTIYVFDISNAPTVSLIGQYSAPQTINDLAHHPTEAVLFEVNNNAGDEWQAINVTNPQAPTVTTGLDLTRSINGVAVHPVSCVSYVAGNVNASNEEITIIKAGVAAPPTVTPTPTLPGPTDTPTPTVTPGQAPTPTFTPTPTPTPTITNTPTPTHTPTPTSVINSCPAYCQSLNYSSGICRRIPQHCGQLGETNETGGNTFCPAPGDPGNRVTCCCQP